MLDRRRVKMATTSEAKKAQAMKIIYAKHVFDVLPYLVEENCHGCQVNHPSQVQHDICCMKTKEEQVECLLELALMKIDKEDIQDEFLEKYPSVFQEPYTTYTPEDNTQEWKNEVKFLVMLLV